MSFLDFLKSLSKLSGMITRVDYQQNRLAFLKRLLSLEDAIGLEIGAADLPTVPANIGACYFADYRVSAEAKIDYTVDRCRPLSRQILDRTFDYIILAHVLEHIPDPIGYLQDLLKLLNDNGIILLVIPDMRRTFDQGREFTSIEHLLNDYCEKAAYPSVEHIMQFAPCVIEELKEKIPLEIFEWAVKNHESGNADVHCHVWTDEHFFRQMDQIIAGGLLPGVSVIYRWPNRGDFNEFMIGLQYQYYK